MTDLERIERDHGIDQELRFGIGAQGAAVATVTNAAATALVALQGAQLLSWAPRGQAPVVWLSEQARFRPGKSLRGGVPVCWPWFGAHPQDPALPAHGFARNHDWEVVQTRSLPGATRLVLRFDPLRLAAAPLRIDAELLLSLTIGESLDLELTTRNRSDSPLHLTQALHTYFHVGDIGAAAVHGLEGRTYVDRLQSDALCVQQGPVGVDGEVDRIYLDCPGELVIADQALGRRIRIERSGSRSCVVWNPWTDKALALGDLGPDGNRRMLCVESTNAWDDAVTVPPGGEHRLGTVVRCEPL
jgi:glucose-6-phosphate 1-epimerase